MTYKNKLLNEREKTYGPYTENARMIQALKRTVRDNIKWDNLTPDKRQSIDMIFTKIGRIITGNPKNIDSWEDIAGYANLISEHLNP